MVSLCLSVYVCVCPFSVLSLLGTPTTATWPEFTSLPNYRNTFPQWPKMRLARVVPRLSRESEGVDFLEVGR